VTVSAVEFFPLLGVAPLFGRTISDDRPNGSSVAVLSYRAHGRSSCVAIGDPGLRRHALI